MLSSRPNKLTSSGMISKQVVVIVEHRIALVLL